jgi:L-malate glycosyltransferase
LKVAFAYNYDPSNLHSGGGITYVHNLITYLLKEGCDVMLFGTQLSRKSIFDHPKFHFIPVIKGSDNWWKFLFSLEGSIRKQNLTEDYIIHTHHPLVMKPFIKVLPRNPKICTFHGIPMDWIKINYSPFYSFIEPIYLKVERNIIDSIDIITTAGNYPSEGLKKRYKDMDLGKKIIEIPSGVNLDIFRLFDIEELKNKYNLEKYHTIILFLGRISAQKNLKFLFNSYSLAKESLDKPVLIIVGRGELEFEMKKYVQTNGIDDIIFMGGVELEQVPELLNCSDLLALTSWYEASPTVVKESLACGVPVVTMDVGDVRKVLTDPMLGTIVDGYDEKEFSDALISNAILIKSKKIEIREFCRKVALEEFGFESIGKRFLSIYRDAI